MAAALLGNSPTVINNVPRLRDIYTFNRVIEATGAVVEFDEQAGRLQIDPSGIHTLEAPYDLVRKMRASFYMLGALLGRFGEARVSLPGGCAWGPRPVDLHLKGMRTMGAEIEVESGYVTGQVSDGVNGGTFTLDPSSVGATVNLLLASVLKAEEFTIKNAAREPDVVLLAESLNRMGADIRGIGTDTLTVRKVDELQGTELNNAPDRIETGTYMIAAVMHRESKLTITESDPAELGSFIKTFRKVGASVTVDGTTITVRSPDELIPTSIKTQVYPGFPTDLQAQWSTLMTQAEGTSKVTDTIYFDRFSYVPELVRLGADMEVKKNAVHIRGKTKLNAASVMSTDLRASVSLVLAATIAEGSSDVLRVYHLDRGYEKLEDKLNKVGAQIKRVPQQE